MSNSSDNTITPPSIFKEINTFVTQIGALHTSLPLLLRAGHIVRQSRAKELSEFLKANGELIENTRRYKLQLKHVPELTRRRRRLECVFR